MPPGVESWESQPTWSSRYAKRSFAKRSSSCRTRGGNRSPSRWLPGPPFDENGIPREAYAFCWPKITGLTRSLRRGCWKGAAIAWWWQTMARKPSGSYLEVSSTWCSWMCRCQRWATTAIREQEKVTGVHQPIIAMTALAMKGDQERCIAAGSDGYLSKPISPEQLDKALDSHVHRRRDDIRSKTNSNNSPVLIVNAAELLQRIDGDRSLLAELVETLRKDYPGQLRGARESIAQGDARGLERVGHALKGALENLSATSASSFAAELESMGRSGSLALAGPKLMALENEMYQVIETLDALLLKREPANRALRI
jgi:HPt (histidine-containing phosphotransfer) domain-containing protein